MLHFGTSNCVCACACHMCNVSVLLRMRLIFPSLQQNTSAISMLPQFIKILGQKIDNCGPVLDRVELLYPRCQSYFSSGQLIDHIHCNEFRIRTNWAKLERPNPQSQTLIYTFLGASNVSDVHHVVYVHLCACMSIWPALCPAKAFFKHHHADEEHEAGVQGYGADSGWDGSEEEPYVTGLKMLEQY